MKHVQEHTLAIRLKICGRFLHYQIGGKAGQQRILMRLCNNGQTTQKELQDVLEISSGAMSEILQKMEDSGLILRAKNAEDKPSFVSFRTSSSTGTSGHRLRRMLAGYGSISQNRTGSIPAASAERSRPPIPENRLIAFMRHHAAFAFLLGAACVSTGIAGSPVSRAHSASTSLNTVARWDAVNFGISGISQRRLTISLYECPASLAARISG